MADIARAREHNLAGPGVRKADRLPLRASALAIPVLSFIGWSLLILLGIAVWSALG